MVLCRLGWMFCFSSCFYDVYLYVGNSDRQNIFNKIETTNQFMIVNMLLTGIISMSQIPN